MMDALIIFSVVAGIIVVGFTGEILIKKAGIPMFIFVILVGIVLGPVLNIFPREDLLSTLALFATLTLLMVLFHAGLGLKTQSVVTIGWRVFVQSIVYALISIGLIGSLGYFVLGWDLIQSFFLAAIIGGEITAAVVVPLSCSMNLKENVVAFLTMESAISSVFSVVIFSTLVDIVRTGENNVLNAVSGVAMQFSAGIVVGLFLSLAWVYILHRAQEQKFTHVLTIGLIFATYSITQVFGGNGILAVLVFGIVFGNYQLINSLLKTKINIDKLQQQVKRFYDELSFLLETLFFVSLGLIFVIDTKFLFAGILFAAILLITRFGAVRLSTFKSSLTQDRKIITIMCALGLTPATLAILATTYTKPSVEDPAILVPLLPLADDIVNIITYVIIITNVITAIGAAYYLRKQKQAKKGSSEQIENQ